MKGQSIESRHSVHCLSRRLYSLHLLYFKEHLKNELLVLCMCAALSINRALCVPLSSPHHVFTYHPPPHSHIHMHALRRWVLVCLYAHMKPDYLKKPDKCRKINMLECPAITFLL